MKKQSSDLAHIPGWGIDIEPANEPTYPMKTYTGEDHERLYYRRPPLQESKIEVLHSTERPGLSAVYGTSTPPKGISGQLRRVAFQYSEGSFKHWMTLLLADRVNMIEGFVEDISKGHLPNIFAEMGWKAIWKHDKKMFARKAGAVLLFAGAIAYLLYRKSKK